MNARELISRRLQNQEKVDCCVWTLSKMGAKSILVLLSCLWVLGCSTQAETKPEPSKEEIRNDADRFFEKLEQEKHGEVKR